MAMSTTCLIETATVIELPEGNPARLDLRPENPCGLLSLLDFMKSFEAHSIMNGVRMLHAKASLIIDSGTDITMKAVLVEQFRKAMRELEDLCKGLEMPMSALQTSQLLKGIDGVAGTRMLDREMAGRIAAMLSVTVENELSLRKFFAVSPERSKYYCNSGETLFGKSVEDSFPSASFDIAEAGRCFALGRFTASVFHLMRALEAGLAVMAKRFGVSSDHTNWQNIIDQIEKAVRGMSSDPNRPNDWKDQQEFFSQAASNFAFIKDAWRNYTAHARGKYTDEEAETILINVRAFMQKLAGRLHE